MPPKTDRRIQSFRYALRGIRCVWEGEPNARLHVAAGALACGAGVILSISTAEWCAIVFAITIVWCAETINTAIEKLTDLACPEINPAAGRIKDIAAGAVLIAALGAVVTGTIVFLPRLIP